MSSYVTWLDHLAPFSHWAMLILSVAAGLLVLGVVVFLVMGAGDFGKISSIRDALRIPAYFIFLGIVTALLMGSLIGPTWVCFSVLEWSDGPSLLVGVPTGILTAAAIVWAMTKALPRLTKS